MILISIFDTFEGTGSNALLIRQKVVQHQSVKMIFIAAWSTKTDFILLMLLNRVRTINLVNFQVRSSQATR
jgi:hypothetical protein